MSTVADRLQECAKSVVGYVWVASTSADGEPHLALSAKFEKIDDTHVKLIDFCCLKTVDNLRENPQLSIGVWDRHKEQGWQVVGKVDQIEASPADEAADLSYVHYAVTLTVQEALHLATGQHSDSSI